MPPQPPWVWGPSEVNAWIRGAYPSKGRPPKERRRHLAPSVRRLRIRILDASVDRVRAGVAEGLAAVGWHPAAGTSHRIAAKVRGRSVVATIHRSWVWRGVVVSLRFQPPIKRSSSRHLLQHFADRFRVAHVSAGEA